MRNQHDASVSKRRVRIEAESLSGLLRDAGLHALAAAVSDALQSAHHAELESIRLATAEAFSVSAEAHTRLHSLVTLARATTSEIANFAIREGNGAVYFAGNSWAPEKAIGFANRLIECAKRAANYTARARKMTMIGLARVEPLEIVSVQ